jgi:hypothetical protein
LWRKTRSDLPIGAERVDAKRADVGHKVGGGAEKNALPGKDY